MHDPCFSIARVFRIIRNDLYERRVQFWISAAAVMAVYATFALLEWQNNKPIVAPFGPFYTWLLFMWGMAFTSGTFRNSAPLREGAFFMGLPAGAGEKLLARYLWSGPGFAAVFTLYIYMVSLVLNVISMVFFKQPVPILPMMPLTVMETIAVYYVLHAAMLCGSILFSRDAFLRTAAILSGAFFLSGIAVVLLFRNEANVVFTFTHLNVNVDYSETIRHRDHLAAALFFYGLLMPLLWGSAYLLLREKEL